MASFHTSIEKTTTAGEKYIHNLLDQLDDQFHIWNNLTYGNEIDFFIIHSRLGILLIEVKDWVISQIQNVDNHEIKGNFYGKYTIEENPLKKIKSIGFDIKNKFEKFDNLINKDGKFKNKLKVPINSIVIFTNIETRELEENNFIGETKFNTDSIITKSELDYLYDSDFEELLFEKRSVTFGSVLRPEEIDFIISNIGTNSGVYDVVTHKLEGTLDAHQEKLTNSKLDKNIIIEGPAGSGKTIVLIKRLQNYLCQNPSHNIGVFSFNAVLANYLKTYINQEIKENQKVDIYYFDNYPNGLKPTYDLILIDEAQDLKPTHYDKIMKLLRGEGKLNLFFDKRQTIYTSSNIVEQFKNKGLGNFEESDLILQKRSPILKLAIAYYEAIKNPEKTIEEIKERTEKITWRMFFSKKTIKSALNWIARKLNLNINNEKEAQEEIDKYNVTSIKQILETNIEQTLELIIRDIKEKLENENAQYHQFMVLNPLFYDKNEGTDLKKVIKSKFKQHFIPFEMNDKSYGCEFDGKFLKDLGDNRSTFKFLHNKVRVFELFHCKGLDADYVYIIDFDKIGEHSRNSELTLFHEREAEYVYVGLTRAKKEINIL